MESKKVSYVGCSFDPKPHENTMAAAEWSNRFSRVYASQNGYFNSAMLEKHSQFRHQEKMLVALK